MVPLAKQDNFKYVAISSPHNRYEQIITNKLSFLFYNGDKAPNNAIYSILVNASYSYKTNEDTDAIVSTDEDTNYSVSGVVYGSARYEIRDKSGKTILSGIVRTSAPYISLHQGYADLESQEDAFDDTAVNLAEQIHDRLLLDKSMHKLN